MPKIKIITYLLTALTARELYFITFNCFFFLLAHSGSSQCKRSDKIWKLYPLITPFIQNIEVLKMVYLVSS